jgi:hypothetical protein
LRLRTGRFKDAYPGAFSRSRFSNLRPSDRADKR